MPSELYLVRLIHTESRCAFPGERLWSAGQLTNARTIRFLRARNREGCDIYIYPYTENQNAGYILVDFDIPRPTDFGSRIWPTSAVGVSHPNEAAKKTVTPTSKEGKRRRRHISGPR